MVCCLQMDMATSVTAHFSFLWDSILKFLSDKILLILCITLCISAKKGNECPCFFNKMENYLTYESNYCIKVQWRIIPEIILEEMGQNE